ncbi:Concanavalin A-like lectin/glucanases superfamily [uncultured Caudovirales phage]|uniref:Concanavalin A-like lectin/glucanases superfamily n=1 Tax=uncultured Caudovirales phage TaxID=2100421 RepID=A0A6J7WGQ3_9CAUD|nr:Concanavalin A-like lectin/glucanases superfamily [uncultured Caudovirales phage]CAB5208561.1 Concanavalin A-like lectin/glucanases superfamily [uncultured Caudovirales phage]
MTAKTTDFSGLLYYNPGSHGFNPVQQATINCANSIDEGATITVDLVTWGIPDGTVLVHTFPLTNISPLRFNISPISPVTNNRASFTIAVDADNTTASAQQSFDIQIRKTVTGPVLATKYSINVNDTSQDPQLLVMDLDPADYVPAGSPVTVTVTYSNIYAADGLGNSGSLFRYNGNIPTQPKAGDTFTFNGTTYTITVVYGADQYTDYNLYAVFFGPAIAPEGAIQVGSTIDIGPNGLTVPDASGQSHPGTLVAAPTFTTGGTAGSGNYFTLDGASQYIVVPSLQNSSFKSVTMSLWFSTAAYASGSLITKELSYKMRLGTGFISVLASHSGNLWEFSTNDTLDPVTAGWHHIAITISPDFIDWYLDGNRLLHLGGIGTLAANTQPFMIGSYGQGTSEFFAGKIGPARLYNYALTTQQVADYYNATKGRYQIGLASPYTVRAYVYGYTAQGNSSSTLTVNPIDYPDVINIPAGARAVGANWDITVTNITGPTAFNSYQNDNTLVYTINYGGTANFGSGEYVEFTW